MPVRLILYDLDGTLVDSKEDLACAVNRTLADLGHPTRPHRELYGFVGNGVRMLLARAVGVPDHAVPPPGIPLEGDKTRPLAIALERFEGHYLNHVTDHSTCYPGVDRVLSHLAHRHQAIVTNKPMVYTQAVVRNLGLDTRVGLVLGGDSTPALKPAPDMLQAALDHFGVAPGDAFMVGDGLPDLGAARALGIPCALLTCGLGDPEVLAAARPDFLLDHIEQILPLVADTGP